MAQLGRLGGNLSQIQPDYSSRTIQFKTREPIASPDHKAQSEQERRANYHRAIEVVDQLIASGRLRKPVPDYILVDVFYDKEVGFNQRGKVLLGRHISDRNDGQNRGSIVIYRDGATSLRIAIETYAHELAHFNQDWNELYEEDEPHRIHNKYGRDAYDAYLQNYHNR